MIKDQHNHFKTYIKKAKDNDYMYYCNACKSSGFYDNLAKHLGSDSHVIFLQSIKKRSKKLLMHITSLEEEELKKKLTRLQNPLFRK